MTNDGEVIYSFPVNFKSILYQKSLINKLRRIYLNYIEPPLAYSVRISFGVMLLTSLAIIFTTFVAISTSSSSSDRDRDRDEINSPNRLNIWLGNSPFDLFYYRNSGGISSNFDEQVIDYYRDQEVLTHLLTHSPTYSLTYLLTHLLTHLLTRLLTHLLSLTHLRTHLLTYSLT